MVANQDNYLEQHNKQDAEKVKELRPDDNSEILIKWISPAVIILFFSLLAIVGLIVGNIMFTIGMVVSAVFLVAFIRIFGGYCLKKSRPYLVMKGRIEIPEKYTPSGEREKVKYEDITKIQYEESQTYGKVLVIKTISGEYIIRRDMSKKVMKALPSSVTDKFQKKREVEEYPDYAEEDEYYDYEEIKDSLPTLARQIAERDDRYKKPVTVIRTFWMFIFAIIAPLAILIYFDPIMLGWILVSIVIVFTAIHLILIEYPLYKYYKNGPDEVKGVKRGVSGNEKEKKAKKKEFMGSIKKLPKAKQVKIKKRYSSLKTFSDLKRTMAKKIVIMFIITGISTWTYFDVGLVGASIAFLPILLPFYFLARYEMPMYMAFKSNLEKSK